MAASRASQASLRHAEMGLLNDFAVDSDGQHVDVLTAMHWRSENLPMQQNETQPRRKLHDTASVVIAVNALLLDGFVALNLGFDIVSSERLSDKCARDSAEG
ncbi:hypothetical protein NDY24_22235 [Xanthomonas hortorum pv. pelargonii]|nr:hypothetical protein NDY24_22235 [Xanthomonas hortorum pv. pelargonii]